jgi:phage virion morphogenesis protein
MSAAISITVRGDSLVEQRLAALAARAGNLFPLFDRIGLMLESTTIERFDDERDPDGAPWKPSIRARETGGKTLTDSARLKQSITYRAGSDQVEVGTNVRYAGIHQTGGTIRGKSGPLKFKLPGGRAFLGLSSEDREEVIALTEDYIAEDFPEIDR